VIYANIVERVKELNNDAWLSLVERCVRDAEVAGSNPVASTKKTSTLLGVLVFLYEDFYPNIVWNHPVML
jgi:hypothetical protein